MAIVNLQAMLNLEDVDQVIALLQQNNWDESVMAISSLSHFQAAASAFYAQEMHNQERRPRAESEFPMDEGHEEVRPPMQFQEGSFLTVLKHFGQNN